MLIGSATTCSAVDLMSFRQPKNAISNIKGMIKQLHGTGVVAKIGDFVRKLS
jgi:hypothetical protein